MRALFLARDDGHFDLFEPGGFKKLMELHFAEAEPVIGVKLASALVGRECVKVFLRLLREARGTESFWK